MNLCKPLDFCWPAGGSVLSDTRRIRATSQTRGRRRSFPRTQTSAAFRHELKSGHPPELFPRGCKNANVAWEHFFWKFVLTASSKDFFLRKKMSRVRKQQDESPQASGRSYRGGTSSSPKISLTDTDFWGSDAGLKPFWYQYTDLYNKRI